MAEGSEVDRVDAFVLKFLNKCLPLFRDSFLEDDHCFSRVDLRVTEYKLVAVREAVQHGGESGGNLEASGVAVLLR